MAFAETPATSGIVNERYQAPSFDMRRFTRAPMRLEGTFFFNAPQETAFERVTDPNMIAKWFSSLITNGYVDHTGSENPGDWGAGTKRYCTLTDGGVSMKRSCIGPRRTFVFTRSRTSPCRSRAMRP